MEHLLGVPDLDAAIRESDDAFIVDLANRIQRLEARNAEKVDALEAHEIAVMAIQQAHRTADAEKRRALANIVEHALTYDAQRTDARGQLLIRTLDALDAVHLHVLRTLGAAALVVSEGGGHSWLCSAPDDVAPDDFAKRIGGRGRALSGSRHHIEALGQVVTHPAEELRLREICQLEASLLKKVLLDLEAQGLIWRHHESTPQELFMDMTAFGVQFLMFTGEPSSD